MFDSFEAGLELKLDIAMFKQISLRCTNGLKKPVLPGD